MTDRIQDKKDSELQKELSEKRAALRGVRFAAAGSQNRNTKERSRLKKEAARILTEMNSRRLSNA